MVKLPLSSEEIKWLPNPTPSTLSEGTIHVWRGQLNGYPDEAEQFLAWLSKEERQRAATFRTHKLRSHFIVGRGLLRLLIGQYLHVSPGVVKFAYNPYGKPSVCFPVCHPELQFNVSHSGDLILLAFTRAKAVGVDLELILSSRDLDIIDLASRFFSKDETDALLKLPQEMQRAAFYKIWTCKEAVIKLSGQGLSLPLNSFSVSFTHGNVANITWAADGFGNIQQWTLHVIKPHQGYVASVASPHSQQELLFFTCPKFPTEVSASVGLQQLAD